MFYVIYFVVLFLLLLLIGAAFNDKISPIDNEEKGQATFIALIWPIVVIFVPIIFIFYFLIKAPFYLIFKLGAYLGKKYQDRFDKKVQ